MNATISENTKCLYIFLTLIFYLATWIRFDPRRSALDRCMVAGPLFRCHLDLHVGVCVARISALHARRTGDEAAGYTRGHASAGRQPDSR